MLPYHPADVITGNQALLHFYDKQVHSIALWGLFVSAYTVARLRVGLPCVRTRPRAMDAQSLR